MNESFHSIENKLVQRESYLLPSKLDEFKYNILPEWKASIENILKRAEQVWPDEHDNDEAVKEKEKFFALFSENSPPILLMTIINFCHFFKTEKGYSRLTDKFNDFNAIIKEIWVVVNYPRDVVQAIKELFYKTTMTINNFDDSVDKFLAIEHLKGFPNDDINYLYSNTINDFLHSDLMIEKSNNITVRRINLQIKYLPLHRSQRCSNHYNVAARIYRIPKYRSIMKRLTALLESVNANDCSWKLDTKRIGAIVEEAKAIQSEINYDIFGGQADRWKTPSRKIDDFLSKLVKLHQHTDWSSFETDVRKLDGFFNIWEIVHEFCMDDGIDHYFLPTGTSNNNLEQWLSGKTR